MRSVFTFENLEKPTELVPHSPVSNPNYFFKVLLLPCTFCSTRIVSTWNTHSSPQLSLRNEIKFCISTHKFFDFDKNISENYGWLRVSKRALNIWPSHVRVWRNQSAPCLKSSNWSDIRLFLNSQFWRVGCLLLQGKRENIFLKDWGDFIRPDKYYCLIFVSGMSSKMQHKCR